MAGWGRPPLLLLFSWAVCSGSGGEDQHAAVLQSGAALPRHLQVEAKWSQRLGDVWQARGMWNRVCVHLQAFPWPQTSWISYMLPFSDPCPLPYFTAPHGAQPGGLKASPELFGIRDSEVHGVGLWLRSTGSASRVSSYLRYGRREIQTDKQWALYRHV